MLKPTVKSGRHSGVRPTTISDLFDEYAMFSRQVRNLAPDTVKDQRVYLDRIAAGFSAGTAAELFSSFSPSSLMSFVADYASCHGLGSRHWLQLTLRGLLTFCHLRSYVVADLREWVPVIHRPRLASIPKAIPDEIVIRLLAGIDLSTPPGMRDAAIIELLSTYGVRGSHIRHLRLSDLDWEGSRIRFLACKRGKDIVQQLTPGVGNRLCDYLRFERPATTGRPEVFIGIRPPHLAFKRSADLSGMISRRLRCMGIELPSGVSRGTHGFRHAFATRLCGKVPLKYISDMLGQRDLSSVMVYSKVNFEDLAQAALPWPEEDDQ
jgi:integrase/recombinase XerD